MSIFMEYSRGHRMCSLRTGFRLIQVLLSTGFTVYVHCNNSYLQTLESYI
jgi:hypothetical protein